MNNYIVKCDICKKTIKHNATMRESVEGGICPDCRKSSIEERIKLNYPKGFPFR